MGSRDSPDSAEVEKRAASIVSPVGRLSDDKHALLGSTADIAWCSDQPIDGGQQRIILDKALQR